jgi:hypothetical protein
MIWHVVFAERGSLPQSRAARSRDAAIQSACELLSRSHDVWRVIEPNGLFIERPQLDEHFDEGRFPGLRRRVSSNVSEASQPQPTSISGEAVGRFEIPDLLPVAAESMRAAAAAVAGMPDSEIREAVMCPAIGQARWKDRVRRSRVALAIANGKGMGFRGRRKSHGQHNNGAGSAQHS